MQNLKQYLTLEKITFILRLLVDDHANSNHFVILSGDS